MASLLTQMLLILLAVSLCYAARHEQSEMSNPKPPIWPMQWNATLAKTAPNVSEIYWTKFYYDWITPASRFDFFNNFPDINGQWTLNCSIVFINTTIWELFPAVQSCFLRATNIPTINPKWLSTATFVRTELYRGIMCDVFYMQSTGVYYWARHGDGLPIRSSNQSNDPGDTDYFDVQIGAQNATLWTIPTYCSNRVSYGCPPFPI